MKVIWALYDDGNCSYKKAIEKYFDGQYKVYCVGINEQPFEDTENYKYKQIDLSMLNSNLIKDLSKLPQPDIILASPPCESWSGADCNGRMFKWIDDKGNWIVQNKNFYDAYNKKCNPVKRRYFIQKEKSRILGEATIGATIEIIKYFNPKIWIIENPQTSKTWMYQKYHWNFLGNENLAYYSSYDNNFSKKPTIFKSNLKLNLKTNKSLSNKNHIAKGSYLKRSSIPGLLIKDIFDQISIEWK